MPRIDQRRESIPQIGDLRDAVVICTTIEKPDNNVSTIVDRPDVIHVHARVRPLEATQILDYQAVWPGMGRGQGGGQLKLPSHEIVIRTPPDVKIDLNHWVFHRDQYTATWYRVRMTKDMGGVRRFLVLLCSIETMLDVRTDPVTQELPPHFDFPGSAVDRI
jgi:hypothetical protein